VGRRNGFFSSLHTAKQRSRLRYGAYLRPKPEGAALLLLLERSTGAEVLFFFTTAKQRSRLRYGAYLRPTPGGAALLLLLLLLLGGGGGDSLHLFDNVLPPQHASHSSSYSAAALFFASRSFLSFTVALADLASYSTAADLASYCKHVVSQFGLPVWSPSKKTSAVYSLTGSLYGYTKNEALWFSSSCGRKRAIGLPGRRRSQAL
jgi:hypothetical protein